MAQATYAPQMTASSMAGAEIADPGPLGLAGFALTTFVLSVINAGWFGVTGKSTGIVVGLAFFYGGLAQLTAGMWEFRKGNVFGATAFTSYAAFWISLATFVVLNGHNFTVPSGEAGNAVGLFLLGWTIFTGILMVASFRLNGALIAVFVALFLTFAALTWGEYAGSTTLHNIGGYLGVVTAIFAWYAAMAGVTKSTFKRDVLPVWPRR